MARAGLVPQLHSGALPESQAWNYVIFKPGVHPLQELALSLVAKTESNNPIAQARQFIENSNQDEKTLHLHTRFLFAAHPPLARLFLLVDQFEQVFTLCRDKHEREQFIENIRYAGTVDGGRVMIVVTMRADFLGRAAESNDLAELFSSHQFIVSPMDKDDLRRAIEEPARAVGFGFEDGLVDRILADVAEEPGTLPLMEHMLWQVFRSCGG